MSAEMLREAAGLMRGRAVAFGEEGEFVNRWSAHPTIDPENTGWVIAHDWDADFDSTVARLPYDYEGRVATHVAAFGHPAVALAVAAWLARTADLWEYGDVGGIQWEYACAVARAYLAPQSARPDATP